MNVTKRDMAIVNRRQRRHRSTILPPRAMNFPHATRGNVEIFVTGSLVNPMNQRGWNGWKASRWTAEWKRAVDQALLVARYRRGLMGDPTTPKRVTLTAHVYNRFDSIDGLRSALKPLPDALKRAGLVHNDDDKSGHAFVYDQVIDRAWPGVAVRVELLGSGA